MYKIMVIEDDDKISRIICSTLEREGFQVFRMVQFENILEEFSAFMPQLILMDIHLPNRNGIEWCKKIRVLSKAPLIFISALDADTTIVQAMMSGGDDYLTKPFSMEVLLAKIKGVLRRAYSYEKEESNILSYQNLYLNTDSKIVIFQDKQSELTHNESGILEILLKNQGKTVSRDRIMRKMWEDESFIDDNTLTVNITRIRKKLEEIGCSNLIKTVRSEGYMI